eukprot:8424887-Karenia_brevis.AAC.1
MMGPQCWQVASRIWGGGGEAKIIRAGRIRRVRSKLFDAVADDPSAHILSVGWHPKLGLPKQGLGTMSSP